MLSQISSRTLETREPCALFSVVLCFHILTKCYSCKPFFLRTIRIAPGCGHQIRALSPCFFVRSVSPWQIHSFHAIADSLSSRKKSSAWNQELPGSFAKTPGVGCSYPFTTKHGFPFTFLQESPQSTRHPSLRRSSPGTRTIRHAPPVRNRYLREATLC
jgi:hypothetical protein